MSFRFRLERIINIQASGPVLVGELIAGTVRAGDQIAVTGFPLPLEIRRVEALHSTTGDRSGLVLSKSVDLRLLNQHARPGAVLTSPASTK